MSRILLQGINKFYGDNHVLKDIDLLIEDGEFMTLLGPSGCGKTTILRVVAGLEKPQSGTIHMDERLVVNCKELFFEPPAKRHLNLVFQSYALWPHMTVFDNVGFGLTVNNTPKREIKLLVENALERMQIGAFANRYPSELSGGQQQRVAIARAIVSSPEVLLLDEPLSNLDARLRIDMRAELKRLHLEMGTTVIYVTHDQVEALTMSTRIAVFFEGRIEQTDAPMVVYQNPSSLRVARFIGNPRINLIEGDAMREGNTLTVCSPLGVFRFSESAFTHHMPENGSFGCVLGLRPEDIILRTADGESLTSARVYSIMPAGSETLIQLKIGGEVLLSKLLGVRSFAQDQQVWLEFPPERMNVFHKDSGLLCKMAGMD